MRKEVFIFAKRYKTFTELHTGFESSGFQRSKATQVLTGIFISRIFLIQRVRDQNLNFFGQEMNNFEYRKHFGAPNLGRYLVGLISALSEGSSYTP